MWRERRIGVDTLRAAIDEGIERTRVRRASWREPRRAHQDAAIATVVIVVIVVEGVWKYVTRRRKGGTEGSIG